MAKRVLIITYHFPPVNVIASRRFGEMAPLMRSFGWEPYILTTESEGDLPVLIEEKNIIRIGKHCDSNKNIVQGEGYKGIPLFLKPFYFLYRKFGVRIESLDRFVFSWRKEVLKHLDKIKEINPDIIVASTSPAACLWLGRDLSAKLKVPWVADFRDLCSLYNPCNVALAKKIDRIIDKQVVKTASAITAVSPYMTELQSRFYQKRGLVIFNGFKKEKLRFLNENIVNNPKIAYSASRFQLHRLPAVELLIKWLRDKDIKLVIRSVGPAEANEEIKRFIKENKAQVELLDPASAEAVLREEKQADYLVIFEDLETKNHVYISSMPGKIFEYLPFAGTILVIARTDSDMRTILKETNRGEVVSSFKELDEFFSKPKPKPNIEGLMTYTREYQTKKLCSLLDGLLEN